MLEVSVSTIQRRRREFGLSDEFDRYSDIIDDELDQCSRQLMRRPSHPLLWEGEAVVYEFKDGE